MAAHQPASTDEPGRFRSTADLVAGFTAGFAQRALTGHRVVSGLGVWVLLALLAPGAPMPARAVLEQTLGTDAEDAAARATQPLDHVHPEVAQAVAVWVQRVLLTPTFDRWAARLPRTVARGPLPTQEEADAWTAQQTLGADPQVPDPLETADRPGAHRDGAHLGPGHQDPVEHPVRRG